MKTVQDILNSGTQYLESRGCSDARYSMQSLLTHVLAKDKTWLYLHFQDPLDDAQLAPLRDLLRRRGQGEPLQHLLGSVEFFRREFRSDARALIPRPETEELVEFALGRLRTKTDLRVLDMGTGSGIIGITLALELAEHKPEVTLIDISDAALSLALENATRLHAKVKTYRSDLFSLWKEQDSDSHSLTPPEGFNLILANLPYIPDGERPELARELEHDPSLALFGGADGLDVIRRFLRELPSYAASEALVLLEVGHDQGEATRALMEELGYTGTEVHCDLNGIARFPMGYAPFKEEASPESTEPTDSAETEQAAQAAEPSYQEEQEESTPVAPAPAERESLRMTGFDSEDKYPF